MCQSGQLQLLLLVVLRQRSANQLRTPTMADRATSSHNLDRASVAVTVMNMAAPLDGRPGSCSLDAQIPARGAAVRQQTIPPITGLDSELTECIV
eukprot:SAG31_NODE_2900_length_4934_cov_2.001448_9_plen_95_part_00